MTDPAAALARLDAALAAHRRAADAVTLAAAEVRMLLAGGPVAPDPAGEVLAALREAAVARGIVIGPDDGIGERDAAGLLGRSPSTLRRWRAEGAGPPWRRLLGRVVYRLGDLAAFLADGTAEGD